MLVVFTVYCGVLGKENIYLNGKRKSKEPGRWLVIDTAVGGGGGICGNGARSS